MIIRIITVGALLMVSFTIGAVWLQTRETKYAKEAKFDCEQCNAIGCQAKFCKKKKGENEEYVRK